MRPLLTARTRAVSNEMRKSERSADVGNLMSFRKWVNKAEPVSIEEAGGRALCGLEISDTLEVVSAMATFTNLRHFTFRQDAFPLRSVSLKVYAR